MSRFNSTFVPARTTTRLPFLGLSWESDSALTFKNWDEFTELCYLLETLANVAYYPNRELTQRASNKKLRQSLGALRGALMKFKSKRVSNEAWNSVMELKKCVGRIGKMCTLEPSDDPEEKEVWCESWNSIAYALSMIAAGSFDAAYFKASVEIHMPKVSEVLDNVRDVSRRHEDAKENLNVDPGRMRVSKLHAQKPTRVRRLDSVEEDWLESSS